MLPPIDPAVLQRNPNFEILYKDLCTRKLNPNGSSRDTKKQRVHDEIRRVRIFSLSLFRRWSECLLFSSFRTFVPRCWNQFICLFTIILSCLSLSARLSICLSLEPSDLCTNPSIDPRSHAKLPLDPSHRSHNPAHNANTHNIPLNPAIQSHRPPTRLARSYRNSNRPTQRPSSSIGSRHSV